MGYKGYLFVHFTGESETGEQIYFSVSRDGLRWQDLNGGSPVIVSKICEKGVRDPFILRNRLDGRFYIIGTDLRIASGKGWGVAQYEGSRKLLVCSSDNLTDWSDVEAVETGVEGAGCVWAPEAVFDEKRGEYLVFWASMIKKGNEDEPKQRIYRSYTKDFKTFSQPELYIERKNHVIDTTVMEWKGNYYRFSKDETTKNIIADTGKDVGEGPFEKLSCPELEEIMGVEGPAGFKFNDREQWCLMVDRFATGKGYMPLITDDLAGGKFRVLNPDEYDMGTAKKRHGSVLNITDDEYVRLIEAYSI